MSEKVFRLVLFVSAFAAIAIFLVLELMRSGIDSARDRIIVGLYLLMMAWSLVRIIRLIKDISGRRK